MILRLLAFIFFVLALGALVGDVWQSYSTGHPFSSGAPKRGGWA